MMHTKPVLANHGPASSQAACDLAVEAHRDRWQRLPWLDRAAHWLMPWSRLQMRAADGGPPQWPLPWR